jgi:hypothetical protein
MEISRQTSKIRFYFFLKNDKENSFNRSQKSGIPTRILKGGHRRDSSPKSAVALEQ